MPTLDVESDSEARVIYEDDELYVVARMFNSNYAVVTFSDAVFVADGTRFFADKALEKAAITCVGFVAKRPNWFPRANVEAARPVLEAFLGDCREVVSYGGSMGGYAAIKYSSLLSFSTTIALCPQWSIDEQECQDFKPGWQQFFEKRLIGMGIRRKDVGGRVFVFSDLSSYPDAHQARMISVTASNITIVNIANVGHHVTSALAGSRNLNDLMAIARDADVTRLRRFCYKQRRFNQHRLDTLARRAFRSRPDGAARTLASLSTLDVASWRVPMDCILNTAEWIARTRGLPEAAQYGSAMGEHLPSVMAQLHFATLLAEKGGPAPSIWTSHGTRVTYDLATGCCSHGQSSSICPPVRFSLNGNGLKLFVDMGGCSFGLYCREDGLIIASSPESTGLSCTIFELSLQTRTRWAIGHNGTFVSAEKGGSLRCNRSAVGGWEMMSFLESHRQ